MNTRLFLTLITSTLLLVACASLGLYSSNGERIYFTGSNEAGQRIAYSGGVPAGGMMMGSRLACASCHGADGRGGLHTMHMQLMDAPDIRFAALSSHEVNESAPHSEDHEGDYSLETFRMAVVDGQHPDGDAIDTDMPRWQLSDSDLADLFRFLKDIR